VFEAVTGHRIGLFQTVLDLGRRKNVYSYVILSQSVHGNMC
jgi:hypothetical protein